MSRYVSSGGSRFVRYGLKPHYVQQLKNYRGGIRL